MRDGSLDYKGKRWQKKREAILRRDKYECQYFKRYGKHREADHVHHIYPVDQFPEYAFEDWNLISLSREAHNMMHERTTGALTVEGKKLQERANKPRERIVVCGLPGTGKTTYVKDHLGGGLAYDLDRIAEAFRLAEPGEIIGEAARKMANDLLLGFASKATDYAPKVFIIRTAPTIEELEAIKPDRVVMLTRIHADRGIPIGDKQSKLNRIKEWCDLFAVPLLII